MVHYRNFDSEVEAAFGYRPLVSGLSSLDENGVCVSSPGCFGFMRVCVTGGS